VVDNNSPVVVEGGGGGDVIQAGGNIQTVTLLGGDGNDVITIDDGPSPVVVNGGGGGDTLNGPDTSNNWDISSDDGGSLNDRTQFSSVENLGGGAAVDTFRLANGRGVSGQILGRGGVDTLDYTAYLTTVLVDLGQGTATRVGSVGAVEGAVGG
jgi:hypothetical protein